MPTSLVNTTQQWDFPNAWPPLQMVMIEALQEVHANHTAWSWPRPVRFVLLCHRRADTGHTHTGAPFMKQMLRAERWLKLDRTALQLAAALEIGALEYWRAKK